ncbi:hypothetical protein GGG17_11905 [Arsenicicoccus sp. MKL-02]|uniref:Polysaccharide chain length determinant N-terminal domain-containing protein n=1 Tax=Arsenicicoccus cauae TaxID=2663847 RepID=A0A6I3IW09_9MICO|nr:hypothetical protein [Arsenicicoccus cauae]MTB72659.1 hypothetical protein [Arsenicicoccus cauae]
MHFRDYVDVLRRQRVVILLCAVLGMAAPLVAALGTAPEYTASTELMFSVTAGNSATDLNQAATYLERSMASYSKLATTPLILDPVRERLGLSSSVADLQERVTATAPTGTILLDIEARAGTAQEAADLANAVGQEMISAVSRLSPADAKGSQTFKAAVVDRAELPRQEAGQPAWTLAAAGLLLGALLGALLAFLVESLDPRARTRDQIADAAGEQPLGVMSAQRVARPDHGRRHARAADSNAVGLITNAIDALSGHDERCICVTALTSRVPVTGPAIQLANHMARSGRRVVLLDANPGGEDLAGSLGLPVRKGLTDVLAASLDDWSDAIHLGSPGLPDIVPLGTGKPEHIDFVSAARAAQLVESLLERYDTVLIDAGASDHAAAETFAQVSRATLVLVEIGRSRKATIKETLRRYRGLGVRSLGVVGVAPRGLSRFM